MYIFAVTAALLSLIAYSNAQELGTEISGQIYIAQGLCINAVNPFPTEFVPLAPTVSDLYVKVTVNGNKVDGINEDVDEEMLVIQTSANEVETIQQDILDVTNGIKSVLENVKSTLSTFTNDLEQLLPMIAPKISSSQNSFNSEASSLDNIIPTEIDGTTTLINNEFDSLPGKLDTTFGGLISRTNSEFSANTQVPGVISALDTFGTSINAQFADAETKLKEEFEASTGNFNMKADDYLTAITSEFTPPTGNIDEHASNIVTRITEEFVSLDEKIEDSRLDLVNFLVSIRDTVRSSKNIMIWSIKLALGKKYGFSAQTSGVNNDGTHSFGKNNNDAKGIDDDGLLVELTKKDLYMITIGIIAVNLIWALMLVYIIVDYLNGRKGWKGFKTMP